MRLIYWDDQAYASELILASSQDQQRSNSSDRGSKACGMARGAAAAEKEGLVEPSKEAEGKAKKRKAESSAAASSKKVGAITGIDVIF